MSRLNWQTMSVGPNELSTQIIGDREGVQQFVEVLMKGTTDGVASAVLDMGNGTKAHVMVKVFDPSPSKGN